MMDCSCIFWPCPELLSVTVTALGGIPRELINECNRLQLQLLISVEWLTATDRSRACAERIWGNCPKFLSKFFQQIFPALFLQDFTPPSKKNSRPKFTPRIVGSPLQFQIFELNIFVHADSLLAGETTSHRIGPFLNSEPAEGEQQQLKMTSDVTSKFPWCCRASVL